MLSSRHPAAATTCTESAGFICHSCCLIVAAGGFTYGGKSCINTQHRHTQTQQSPAIKENAQNTLRKPKIYLEQVHPSIIARPSVIHHHHYHDLNQHHHHHHHHPCYCPPTINPGSRTFRGKDDFSSICLHSLSSTSSAFSGF